VQRRWQVSAAQAMPRQLQVPRVLRALKRRPAARFPASLELQPALR
jgi:hypothetical protein